MEIILANPRGFCAGVDRAIEIVERALQTFGKPVYVRHEVVHNRYVVDDLKNKGAVFVEELHEVPDDAIVIFSAHGVSQAVQQEAGQRQLQVFDATCPLVTKVHLEVARHARDGHNVILIGHQGHPEVEGTLGQYDSRYDGNIYLVETREDVDKLELDESKPLAYVTQTTLSVDDTSVIIERLRQRFPDIKSPRKDDICYATQNRQDAVKQLSQLSQLVLVVGSRNSSNSNRLRELAQNSGVKSYLIDGEEEIEPAWLQGIESVGITAGASAPEHLVQKVIQRLTREFGATVSEDSGPRESIVFQLPKELR